jgi:iron complex outermembrane receptor protein
VNLRSKLSVRAPVALVTTTALAVALAAPALAQEVPATSAAAPADSLQEVVVTGVREAMKDSLAVKRASNLISDDISTVDIGQLPDVTIAEELDRLPGVNTTRDRGNASEASIRGLGPRLVLGLVNGREVASSEPSQELRWEIFPSEILSGAQVYKTQDASLIPGGIAATVDIRTISPLDYHGPKFTVQAGPEYDDLGKSLPHYDPLGYRASAGYVSHLNDNLAVAVAGSIQREKNAFSDFRTWGWNTPFNTNGNTGDLNGDGTPDNTTWGLNTEAKEITQNRSALTTTIAWRASDALTLKFDALYSQYTIQENDFQAWFANNILGNWDNGNASIYNAPGNSYQIVNGTVVGATLNNAYPDYESEIANYQENHQLFATGLNGAWHVGQWSGQVDLSFSDAKRRNQWEAIYLSDLYPPNLTYGVAAGQAPYATTPGFDPADPALQSVGGYRQNSGSNVDSTGQSTGPEYTHDSLGALAIDFTRHLSAEHLPALHFGARLSARRKRHQEFQYGLCPGSGSTVFTMPYDQGAQACPNGVQQISLANAGLQEFQLPGITAPPMVYGNFDALRAMVYPNDAVPAGAELLLDHTTVTEHTYDGYVKVDFAGSIADLPLTGDVGVRVSRMQSDSSGFQTQNGSDYTPVAVGDDYTNVLPSLNAVLRLSDTQMLRFGTSIGIARAPLDALVTGFTLNTTASPPTGSGGNPKLRPYKADQLDLSYEWYFHEESLLAVAPFYKHLSNIIGASTALEDIGGVNYLVTTENNAPGGHVDGVELTFQTRFFFLPGYFRNLGIYGNYAYVNSNIHELTPMPDPFPMVGLAKDTSELDIYYDQAGFETRVSWKHHSPFTVAPTWVATSLKTLAAEDLFDASVSYTWDQRWSVRLQGANLTNERARFTTDNNPENLANDGGYQLYGRTYQLDLSLRM